MTHFNLDYNVDFLSSGVLQGATLYVKGLGAPVAGRFLYVGNSQDSGTGATLFIEAESEPSSNRAPLFVKGLGTIWGAYVSSQSLPLFISRDSGTEVVPLFLCNKWADSNSYATLCIEGVTGIPNGSAPLYTMGVTGLPNSYVNLWVGGRIGSPPSLSATLFAEGRDEAEGGIPLVVWHSSTQTNSYAPLFVDGNNPVTASVELAVPSTRADETGVVELYVSGY